MPRSYFVLDKPPRCSGGIAAGVVLVAALLSPALAQAQITIQPIMTNSAVERMVRNGVSLSAIIQAIKTAKDVDFLINNREAFELIGAGASDSASDQIQKAMHQRMVNGPETPPAQPVASPAPIPDPSPSDAPVTRVADQHPAAPVTAKVGGGKAVNWQIGHVMDTDRAAYLVGVWQTHHTTGIINGTASTNATTLGGLPGYSTTQADTTYNARYSQNSTDTATPIYAVYAHYAIEDGHYVYLAQEHLWHVSFYWSKPARLIVNGEVRFTASGRKMTILDEDGKKHTAEITRQVLKPQGPRGE